MSVSRVRGICKSHGVESSVITKQTFKGLSALEGCRATLSRCVIDGNASGVSISNGHVSGKKRESVSFCFEISM